MQTRKKKNNQFGAMTCLLSLLYFSNIKVSSYQQRCLSFLVTGKGVLRSGTIRKNVKYA